MGAYDERDFLVSRIADAADIADRQQVPHFIGFLDEAGCALCQTYLKKHRLNAALFGGYDRAERRVLGVFPAWDTPGGRTRSP